MNKLNRISVGNFDINQAITLDEIEKNKDNVKFFEKKIIKIEDLFKEYESITLEEKNLQTFLNGVKTNCNLDDGICKVYDKQGKFIGLAEIKNKKLKRDVIF